MSWDFSGHVPGQFASQELSWVMKYPKNFFWYFSPRICSGQLISMCPKLKHTPAITDHNIATPKILTPLSLYHRKISNNIWTLGYDSNRTYSTVLNMYPYVENPWRDIFYQISQSSKFLHYRVTLHGTEDNKTAKGNHPKMVNRSFLSKGIVSTVLLLILS